MLTANQATKTSIKKYHAIMSDKHKNLDILVSKAASEGKFCCYYDGIIDRECYDWLHALGYFVHVCKKQPTGYIPIRACADYTEYTLAAEDARRWGKEVATGLFWGK